MINYLYFVNNLLEVIEINKSDINISDESGTSRVLDIVTNSLYTFLEANSIPHQPRTVNSANDLIALVEDINLRLQYQPNVSVSSVICFSAPRVTDESRTLELVYNNRGQGIVYTPDQSLKEKYLGVYNAIDIKFLKENEDVHQNNLRECEKLDDLNDSGMSPINYSTTFMNSIFRIHGLFNYIYFREL